MKMSNQSEPALQMSMKEHLINVIEEGYEVHLNDQILRHDGEFPDGRNVYVIIKGKIMKEFITAADAVEEWLKT